MSDVKSRQTMTRDSFAVLARIQALLEFKPSTCAYLALAMGIAPKALQSWIAMLRAEQAIHIVSWVKTGVATTAVYSWGPGINVPRPESEATREKARFLKRRAAADLRTAVATAADKAIRQGCPLHVAFFEKSA